jgi:hypothetical protein
MHSPNQKPKYSIGSVILTPLGEGIIKMHFSNLNKHLPDRWSYMVLIGYELDKVEHFMENQLKKIRKSENSNKNQKV